MAYQRIMISGLCSGGGKTTLTAALLKAFQNRGLKVQSFKCGPDYIDPQLHGVITGKPPVNLDPFMSTETGVVEVFQDYARNTELCVAEGAMGYYDGMGKTDTSSAWHVARLLKMPVVLAVNPSGSALTAAAMVKGLMGFRKPSHIIGVVLCNIKEGMYAYYKDLMEANGIFVFGCLPHMEAVHFKSRHLGLYQAGEIEDLQQKIDLLGAAAEKWIDLEGLIEASKAQWMEVVVKPIKKQYPITLGVAYDDAFSFYYQHNLRLFENLGAKLVYFSPLRDPWLPGELDGVLLGGGYPELFAEGLSRNKSFLQSFRGAAEKGIPIFAECGGFMYLNQVIKDSAGGVYPMSGILPGTVYMTDRLCRFGYSTMTAKEDNLLLRKGESLRGHEFHYSDSTQCGGGCVIEKSGGRRDEGIFTSDTLFAGYPHIDFYSNRRAAVRFLKKCAAFREQRIDKNMKK